MPKAKKSADRPLDPKSEPQEAPSGVEPPATGSDPAAAGVESKPEAPAAPAVAGPDYKDLYLRALAELDNFRKVSARERRALIDSAAEGVLRKLLDPSDAFDRAVAELERLHQGAPESMQPVLQRSVEGLSALHRQLSSVLATEGVERLVPRGAMFDPARHEAVARVERSDVPEGTIIDVVQAGYTLRGTLLRPARVVVAAGTPNDDKQGAQKEEQT